jgi:hypothetical protein
VIYGALFSLPEGLGVPVAPDSPWPPLRSLHGWAVEQEPTHLDPPRTLIASTLFDGFVQTPMLIALVYALVRRRGWARPLGLIYAGAGVINMWFYFFETLTAAALGDVSAVQPAVADRTCRARLAALAALEGAARRDASVLVVAVVVVMRVVVAAAPLFAGAVVVAVVIPVFVAAVVCALASVVVAALVAAAVVRRGPASHEHDRRNAHVHADARVLRVPMPATAAVAVGGGGSGEHRRHRGERGESDQ